MQSKERISTLVKCEPSDRKGANKMKWKEFIKKAKEAGIQDDDEIDWIDIGDIYEPVFNREKFKYIDDTESKEWHVTISG